MRYKKYVYSILLLIASNCFSQKIDTIYYTPSPVLEEVIVLGEHKIKKTKLGYLNKENFTLSLYKDYEIGVFIPNGQAYESIEDVYLKINNELLSTCKIQLNFYTFDKEPKALITSLQATIDPSNKKKQVISTENLRVNFPKEGIFVSVKILSELKKQDESHLRIYLTEKYNVQATFIRGAVYGNEWSALSKLNIGKSPYVNACYGFFSIK